MCLFVRYIVACIESYFASTEVAKKKKLLAHALLNELFNVFPILFHVKVCVGAMLFYQKPKRVAI